MASNEQPAYHWQRYTEPLRLRPVDGRFFARISPRAHVGPRQLLRETVIPRCDVCGKPVRHSPGARLFHAIAAGRRSGKPWTFAHRRCARLPAWLRRL